jgi:HEAT repeat protein
MTRTEAISRLRLELAGEEGRLEALRELVERGECTHDVAAQYVDLRLEDWTPEQVRAEAITLYRKDRYNIGPWYVVEYLGLLDAREEKGIRGLLDFVRDMSNADAWSQVIVRVLEKDRNEAVAILLERLDDLDPLTPLFLGELGDARAIEPLAEQFMKGHEAPPWPLDYARALAKFGEAAVPVLTECLECDNPRVVRAAETALRELAQQRK